MSGDLQASDMIKLRSRLAPIDIAYRMRDLVGHRDGARPVDGLIGNGTEKEFSLFRADKPDNLVFQATLIADGEGTVIDGHFGAAMGRVDHKDMLGCWIFALLVAGGGAALHFALDSFMGSALIAIAILIMGITVMIVRDPLRRRRARPDSRERIVEFLHKHLEIVPD